LAAIGYFQKSFLRWNFRW